MAGTEHISLLDSLSSELLQFPFAAMRDVGPAVQTLAGILRITKKDTFREVAEIASKARLPLKTCRNHLRQLEGSGWIINDGRGHTRAGAPRRTCTIRVTPKTLAAMVPGDSKDGPTYGLLPWWASAKFEHTARQNAPWKSLPWGSRAVLSLVMARLATMKSAIAPGKERVDAVEFWGELTNREDDRHFRFSQKILGEVTGLSKRAIVDAKDHLRRRGFIDQIAKHDSSGGCSADVLMPNRDFACVITSISQDRCFIKLTNLERQSA